MYLSRLEGRKQTHSHVPEHFIYTFVPVANMLKDKHLTLLAHRTEIKQPYAHWSPLCPHLSKAVYQTLLLVFLQVSADVREIEVA